MDRWVGTLFRSLSVRFDSMTKRSCVHLCAAWPVQYERAAEWLCSERPGFMRDRPVVARLMVALSAWTRPGVVLGLAGDSHALESSDSRQQVGLGADPRREAHIHFATWG